MGNYPESSKLFGIDARSTLVRRSYCKQQIDLQISTTGENLRRRARLSASTNGVICKQPLTTMTR
eukprot:scaffold118607_cov11-Prasinocladus_malaysianus.AAC.1